jgi:type IV pilus assembly protein PilA
MHTLLRDLRERREDDDAGFSLIELAFVLVLIAILIGIAVPTFLGIRQRGQDRQAQSALRNALSVARAINTDTGSYPADVATAVTQLNAAEPNLTFQAGAITGNLPRTVRVAASSASSITLRALSASGTCFELTDSFTSGTTGPSSVAATDCTNN